MTVKHECGCTLLTGTVGTKKATVYYDNNGNAINNCPKCKKQL